MAVKSRWGAALALPLTLMACGKVSEIGGDTGGAGGTDTVSTGGTGGAANVGAGAGGVSAVGGSDFGGGNAVGGSGTAGSAFGGGPGTGGASFGGGPGSGGFSGTGGALAVEGFYVSEFELGERDPNGVQSSTAWQYYGVDRDGLTSTQASTNHCKLQLGANPSVKRDGINGIDNSFGANILPLLLGVSPALSQELNARVAGGDSIAIATPTGFDLLLAGSMARATNFNASPIEEWWFFSQDYPGGNPTCSLEGEILNGQIIVWGTGYWELALPVASSTLIIPIRQPSITGNAPANGQAPDVMLSGVIRTEEFVDAMRQVAGALDPSLCSGSSFDSIAQQVRAASDIMDDGPNGDPSRLCNGISIGIEAKLRPTQINGFVNKPVEPHPCP